MKRYKLLKDLPTFNKGDIFRLTEHGHLMSEKAGVIAYAEPTLEKFNILDSGWFEEIPESKRWCAKKGEDTMKRYKLLKDLAGLEAGSTLYLNELGNLVASDKTTIVFLANFIHHYNLLDSDWLEGIPEGKRWRAEKDEVYWCVKNDGGIADDYEQRTGIDDRLYKFGNYFKTEEEAQKASDWLKAFAVLRDDTKGFKPDWKNEKQRRWYVFYSLFNGEFYTEGYIDYHPSPIIFATKDDAQASIKNHEQEWRTFFNRGVEE